MDRKKLKLSLVIVITLLLGRCSTTTSPRETAITSLEAQIDSMAMRRPLKAEHLVDSLLLWDSMNVRALSLKGNIAMNRRRPAEAIPFLAKAFVIDNSEVGTQYTLALCLEQVGRLDEAKEHCKNLLPKIDTSEYFSIRRPELMTVVERREAGLESLKDLHDMKDVYRLQLENDISNYQGGGISEFVPWSYFFDTAYQEFYIQIPDSLYDNKIVYGMSNVELFYARLGINVSVTGTDSKNKGYKLRTDGAMSPCF